jgi:four helix bundle protein
MEVPAFWPQTAGMAITRHTELRIYQRARKLAKRIYDLTNSFPKEERYRLGDQAIRSSRAAMAAIPEAWRFRHYRFQFLSKLTESEAEAAETQAWLDVAFDCGFIDEAIYNELQKEYDSLIGGIVQMKLKADDWCQFHPRQSHKIEE